MGGRVWTCSLSPEYRDADEVAYVAVYSDIFGGWLTSTSHRLKKHDGLGPEEFVIDEISVPDAKGLLKEAGF